MIQFFKTGHKRAENVPQEQEVKYKALVETTDTGYVIIDKDGKVVDANAEYIRLTGHSSLDEIRGRSVVEWTADYEKEKNAAAVAKCAKDGYIRNLEIDYADKQGKITPIEINATVVELGGASQILTLCRDISERKQNEEKINQFTNLIRENISHIVSVLQKVAMGDLSQNIEIPKKEDEFTELLVALNLTIDDLREARKLQEINQQEIEKQVEEKTREIQVILDSVPAWVFYKDKENRFIKVNEAFCRVMEKTKKELEGKSCFDLYPKEQADAFLKDDLEVIKSAKPKRNIIEPMKSPKGKLWVQTDKIPYENESKNIIGIIGFTIDITAKKLAEDELKKALEISEQANKLMVGRELEMIKLKEQIKKLSNNQ